MNFATLADFITMGGHGLYVWLSYAAALIVVAYNVLAVRLRRRRYLRELVDRERRHGTPGDPADGSTGVRNS